MNNKARSVIVEKQVTEFRNFCGLGATEAIQLKSLLLKLNVMTLYRPLSENFSGMSIKDGKGNRFMLINSNDPIGRQHFTIAHELYHLFIEESPKPHICTKDGVKSEVEKHADMFASALLIPAPGVSQLIPDDELFGEITIGTVVRAEHYFSVSRIALLNRLRDLGFISNQQKEALKSIPVIQSAKDCGYDTALYKSGNANLFIGNLGEKARKLFDAGKISEGHYIEILNKLNYADED